MGSACATAMTVVLILLATAARAQELEPRAYSAAPVGVNFLVADVTHLHSESSLDPSLPIKNVHADVDLYVLAYVRTFGLAGRSASLGLAVPYLRGDVSGDVFENSRVAHRSGIGDVRLRLAVNLLGGPALSPRESTIDASAAALTVGAPVWHEAKDSVSIILGSGHSLSTRRCADVEIVASPSATTSFRSRSGAGTSVMACTISPNVLAPAGTISPSWCSSLRASTSLSFSP